jgi:hypothetical protein
MDPEVALTCMRRPEPFLCATCWNGASRKQFDHDKAEFAETQRKFDERVKRARLSSSSSSFGSAVNSLSDDISSDALARCERDSPPTSGGSDDEVIYTPHVTFLECLQQMMPKRGKRGSATAAEQETQVANGVEIKQRGRTEEGNGQISNPVREPEKQKCRATATPPANAPSRVSLTVEGRPWSAWAGVRRPRPDVYTSDFLRSQKPPQIPNNEYLHTDDSSLLERAEQVYRGEVIEHGPEGETQRLYGETRPQILAIIIAETGFTDLSAMNIEINKQLEEFVNVQFAVVAVSKHYHINLRTVTESLRDQIEWEQTSWENDESWEIHWRKCQSGFMRCRTEARRAAKVRILQ